MNFTLLKQPYPFSNSFTRHFVMALLFGFFVFVFLFIFQPFGLQTYQDETKIFKVAGYGLITTASILLNYLLFTWLFPVWYQRKTWTVGKNILYALWMFLLIGVFNWLYSCYLEFWGFSWKTFFLFQAMTLLVGIFPVTISTFITYSRRMKESLREVQSLNQELAAHPLQISKTVVHLPSQNKSESRDIEIDQLLYIRSVENYVEVHLRSEKLIMRNTLKAIEQSLSEVATIKRCHRSYLVNLQKIETFSGNAQGLSLKFAEENSEEIPVSRAFVSEIKAAL